MSFEEVNPSEGAIVRRAKAVEARELTPSDVVVIEPPPSELATRLVAPAPAIEPLKDPGTAPAVDPTVLSQRKRKHKHELRYHFTQLSCIASLAASALAVVFIGLSDGRLGRITATVALALGLISVALAWGTRLTSRALGYAASASILAAFACAFLWAAPAQWFEDASPEQRQHDQLQPQPSARKAAPAAPKSSE